ncbi:hypothetical protein U1E44_05780 [Arenibacter sp. GZD96]|uniref:hypothetical protein n=1 Tax=Aurantibrevibacter litoralis TaxID=3106030 RepID=UPI002AFEF463|nr:hypothetical protein [Arenibacter sp. GZD-96]MEA1785592.1 hypothetical protein [Arenibacter sp. GZD-96]
MYKKFTRAELVSILWDIRDIPEYLDEMSISELKQIDTILLDWNYVIHKMISEKFIESGYKSSIWTKLKNENLFNGFSMIDVDLLRNRITAKLDPIGLEKFNENLKKLSNGFEYKYSTTKYTIIYHFLNTELKTMPISQERYFSHIRENFDLNGKKFKRLSFDECTDKRFEKNKERLMQIMKE